MSEPNTNPEENQPANNLVPPVSPGNEDANVEVQQAENSRHTTNQPSRKKVVIKRIIAFLGNKNKQQLIANVISLFMLLVTAFLAFYTWRVFNQTTKQTEIADNSAKAAKISADAAKLSADLQKQALDNQISAKKESDKSDAEKTKREVATFDLQKKALDKQIEGLKETQNEFEIENRPLVNLANMRIESADPGRKFKISFWFVNSGKQTAQIIKSGYDMRSSQDSIYKVPSNITERKEISNSYLGAIQDIPVSLSSVDTVSAKSLIPFNTGKEFIFVFGYVTYKGLYTPKVFTYRFAYKIINYPAYTVQTITTETK